MPHGLITGQESEKQDKSNQLVLAMEERSPGEFHRENDTCKIPENRGEQLTKLGDDVKFFKAVMMRTFCEELIK